ncbi:MAG: hypothetical protein J5871_04270 [Bacteroidales bacterium]|nr:hypothetical protein [Bacteroidales bacterium]
MEHQRYVAPVCKSIPVHAAGMICISPMTTSGSQTGNYGYNNSDYAECD